MDQDEKPVVCSHCGLIGCNPLDFIHACEGIITELEQLCQVPDKQPIELEENPF